MNPKQLALLLVLLAALGGGFLLVQHNRDQALDHAASGVGAKLLGENFPINDVTHITLKHGDAHVNLFKTDVWRIRERDDYPASFSRLSAVLLQLTDLKVVQSEPILPSQLAQLELGPGANSGLLMEFRDKNDKPILSLTLGKMHSHQGQRTAEYGMDDFPDGRYVMLASDPRHALVVGDPLTIEANPALWIEKTFFKVSKPRSIAMDFPDPTNSWKLMRETEAGEWKLADIPPDEHLDTNRVMEVSRAFGSPTPSDVLPLTTKPEDTGLDKPTVVKIETFDDFTYTVKLGRLTNANYPLTVAVAANYSRERPVGKDEKPEDKAKADQFWKDHLKALDEQLKLDKSFEKWTFLIGSANVDLFLKERKYLFLQKQDKPADKPDAGGDKKDDAPKPPADKGGGGAP